MRATSIALWSLFLSTSVLLAQTAEQVGPESLVRSYLAAKETAMQERAGEAEIQKVISFLTDSVVYDHPRAGAHIVGKSSIAEGMRGFLGATRQASIVVLHLVASPAVVVVEDQVTFEAHEASRWVPTTRTQVTVFEVVNGHISHVVEMWQPH
jgi:hypothetical protein